MIIDYNLDLLQLVELSLDGKFRRPRENTDPSLYIQYYKIIIFHNENFEISRKISIKFREIYQFKRYLNNDK